MNTRQKLTIGIAAIFMVTLTIVGVTYAYFVTQVREGEKAGANVTTAEFGEVTFVKQDASVTLDAMADDDTKSLNYAVTNNGEGALSYDLVVRHTDGDKSFIKSMVTDGTKVDACYNLTETELVAIPTDGECFTGNFYDNVTVKVMRYTTEGRTDAGTEVYSGRLQKASSYDIATSVPIEAGATHYYTITVTHVDAGVNQNLETEASVTIIPDIDSIG